MDISRIRRADGGRSQPCGSHWGGLITIAHTKSVAVSRVAHQLPRFVCTPQHGQHLCHRAPSVAGFGFLMMADIRCPRRRSDAHPAAKVAQGPLSGPAALPGASDLSPRQTSVESPSVSPHTWHSTNCLRTLPESRLDASTARPESGPCATSSCGGSHLCWRRSENTQREFGFPPGDGNLVSGGMQLPRLVHRAKRRCRFE